MPDDVRLDPGTVGSLLAGIRLATRAIEERLCPPPGLLPIAPEGREPDPKGPDPVGRDGVIWTWADEFMAAFPHLTLADGMRAICLATEGGDDRVSRVIGVRVDRMPRAEDAGREPGVPDALADSGVLFHEEVPAGLPPWIAWELVRFVSDDGTPAALFERSMFARWHREPVNFGHFAGWMRQHVVTAPPFPEPPSRAEREEARLHGDALTRFPELAEQLPHVRLAARDSEWVREDDEPWPADWRPRVRTHVGRDTPGVPLPRSPEALDALGDAPFAVVEFFARTEFMQESVSRYRDWWADGRLVASEYPTIAEGPRGYIV